MAYPEPAAIGVQHPIVQPRMSVNTPTREALPFTIVLTLCGGDGMSTAVLAVIRAIRLGPIFDIRSFAWQLLDQT